MRVALLLTITIVVRGDSSDESKFVDLLPEEEKEEFIKNVARRIVENVETKEVSNKSSVELSDDELIGHEAFVKQILKEETKNVLRSRMAKAKEETYTEEDVKVKPLENLKHLDRDDDLDLTLRNKKSNIDKDEDDSKISVEVVTEKNKIKTNNFGEEVVENTTKHPKLKVYEFIESSDEDIEVRTIKTTTENIVTKTNNDVVKNNVTTESPEVIVNSSKDTHTNLSNRDPLVKNVKRRAIETISTSSSTVNSGQNNTESTAKKMGPTYNEHKNTVINDFDATKVYSDQENSKHNGDITTKGTVITTTKSTIHKPKAKVTTIRKESFENYQLTEPSYVSAELEKSGSDKDCSNETATVNNKNNTMLNKSDVETLTLNKEFRRNEDESNYIKLENVTAFPETIDFDNNNSNTNRIRNTTGVNSTSKSNDDSIVSEVYENNSYFKLKVEDTFNSTDNITESIISDRSSSDIVKLNNSTILATHASYTEKSTTISTELMPVTPNNTDDNTAFKMLIPNTFAVINDTNVINKKEKLELRTEIKPGYNRSFPTTNLNDTTEDKKQGMTTENRFENATDKDATSGKLSKTKIFANTIENKDNEPHPNMNMTDTINVTKTITTEKPTKILPNFIADRAVKMLRESLMMIDEKTEDLTTNVDSKSFYSLQKEYQQMDKNNATKGYRVYEIPADKPPFIKGSETITEQPYYVPIYNYSPNNAYFNAQNKLGPNPDDDQAANLMETDLDGLQRMKSEDDTGGYEDHFESFKDDVTSETQRKKFGSKDNFIKTVGYKLPRPLILPVIIRQPGNNKNPYNPDDYADIDYYSRVGSEVKGLSEGSETRYVFPDSDEDTHPYNSIAGHDLKDHIRAARYMLFQNKYFGYPGASTTEKEASSEPEELDNSTEKYFRNGDKSSISLDYYFGRMKPYVEKDKLYKKVGYFKNSHELKDLYMNNDYFNKNIIKYINSIKYKNENYVNQAFMTVTPHTEFKDSLKFRRAKMKKKKSMKDAEEDTHYAKVMTSIHSILSVTDERDLIPNLEKLQSLNLPIYRRHDTKAYLKVLKDMVRMKDNALKQYDWLGTTVDLQSAIQKLFELTEAIEYDEDIHPSDLELVKYVIFLHKYTKDLILSYDTADKLRKKQMLPRNKKNSKHIISDKGLVNRVWLYLRKKQMGQQSILDDFSEFLGGLQEGLYELHQAITNIARVTKFKEQNWFRNVKELYLSDNKSYLGLLLHLAASRLFGMIEENSVRGMEIDFKSYVRENREETMKMAQEMSSVIQIIDEINKYK